MTKPTKKPEHSPLPWELDKDGGFEEPSGRISDAIEISCVVSDVWIAQIQTKVDSEIQKANATLIVRRVNSGSVADEIVELILDDTVFGNLKVAKVLKAARQYQAMQKEQSHV